MAVRPEPLNKPPLPLGTDPHSVRQRVEALERVMERLFVIPGTNRQVGLDVILDLVPVLGSTAGAVLGSISSMLLYDRPDDWVRTLKARTGVPDYRFDHLMGIDACDAFTQTLADIAGVAVRDVTPELLEGRKLSSSKIVPMPLVDAEQVNKQENRVVLAQQMALAPIGHGPLEFILEVRSIHAGLTSRAEAAARRPQKTASLVW